VACREDALGLRRVSRASPRFIRWLRFLSTAMSSGGLAQCLGQQSVAEVSSLGNLLNDPEIAVFLVNAIYLRGLWNSIGSFRP
jgi:hypothetical protein